MFCPTRNAVTSSHWKEHNSAGTTLSGPKETEKQHLDTLLMNDGEILRENADIHIHLLCYLFLKKINRKGWSRAVK